MTPNTRALVAATAYATITGKKVAGVYDHEADAHLRIAAECRGDRVQALDGDGQARFGGTLPELFDEASAAFVSLETNGTRASGYDRSSLGFYTADVIDGQVQLYDHSDSGWFTFDIQIVEHGSEAS